MAVWDKNLGRHHQYSPGEELDIEALKKKVISALPGRHSEDIWVEVSQTQRLAVPPLQSLHPRLDGAQVGGNDGVALPQDRQGAVCRRRRTLCRSTEQSVTHVFHMTNTVSQYYSNEISEQRNPAGVVWKRFTLETVQYLLSLIFVVVTVLNAD